MVDLHTAACELIRKGVNVQSPYETQLFEELDCRVEQERRTKVAEQKGQERANLESIKETIKTIQTSTVRCTCHDFFNWRDLWRIDPYIARRLRDTGHHLPDCLLARVKSPVAAGKDERKIIPTTDPKANKFKVVVQDPDQSGYMLVTSCLDHVDTCSSNNGVMTAILLERGSTSPYDDGCPELVCRRSVG